MSTIELSDGAFDDCANLESIIIPTENIIMNFENTFSLCPKLTNIYYHMNNFPAKRDDVGTRKLRYFALIKSVTSYKENTCGSVEIDAYASIEHEHERFEYSFTASNGSESRFNKLSVVFGIFFVN